MKKIKPRILFLTRKMPESFFLEEKLKAIPNIEFLGTIVENKNIGKISLIKKKINKLIKNKKLFGIIYFLINLPFLFFIERLANFIFIKRWNINEKAKIKNKFQFNVENFNSIEAQNKIKKLNPELILVYGTRILSHETFSIPKKGSLNIHLGITPEYRGSKSEFWALFNKEQNMLGYTIHRIDKGIDTGKIVFQQYIPFNKGDNFISIRAKSIEHIAENIENIINNFLNKKIQYLDLSNRKSRLYSTPYLLDHLILGLRFIFNYFKKYFK